MATPLWLLPALPFAGFLVLALLGSRLSRPVVAALGISSVGLATATAGVLAAGLRAPGITQSFGAWFEVGGLRPELAFRLDPLSLVMVLVVTGVGFLIHVYSAEFMEPDEGYARFFAYMNLFVAAMLVLVLADDFLLLYLGWEGVGLCSYLLIGFWYREPANGHAARKAFVVTRVGDAAMAIGLFLVYWHLRTLRIDDALGRAVLDWAPGSAVAVTVAALLLAGAVGKSAQLPLQTWLPDAMAGPTPVSALIHAATMVTAGVYLIARTHPLFELAPPVMAAVAVIGAATLLLAGVSALFQRDIKRVLAYSTISQIGYMFLALGVGAWSAALFHLATHAFFKALLFLGAGAVILALHHEHDLFRMGGLRRELPVTFWTMLLAGASLAGLPLVTAGFYSKEAILQGAYSAETGGAWLWGAGVVGVLLTGLYTFRLIVLAFLGEARTAVERRPGLRMTIPMVVLALLSVVGGLLPVVGFLSASLGGPPETAAPGTLAREAVASVAALLGAGLAWRYRGRRAPAEGTLAGFWRDGWGFDHLYDVLFVGPVVALARINRADVLDRPYEAIAGVVRLAGAGIARTQTGRVRLYAAAIALGAIVVLAVGALL
jgi:NADH-quinone oxidoreductase subunit L